MKPIGRRRVLIGAAAALFFPAPAIARRRTFLFGLTPVFLTNDRKLLALIRSHIAEAINVPVELVQRRTYQDITTMLLAGELDAAWICGYPYIRHRAELELIAVPVWHGRQLYQAYLIAHEGRDAGQLDQLAGDVHAFSDPDSNSGYLVTRSELARNRQSPDQFFSRAFFTYGHRNVVRAVSRGLAQSGSVDGYVWEALSTLEPSLTAKTSIVWKSEWLGFPPVARRRFGFDAGLQRDFAAALTTMQKGQDGKAALDLLQLEGFAQADPTLFDGIAARVSSLGNDG